MKISSIFLEKLDNGNYRSPRKPNEEMSAKAVEECMHTYHKIPGAPELYYDETGNVCVNVNVNIGEDLPKGFVATVE